MPISSARTTPNLKEFRGLIREYSMVPVSRTVAADLETPVSAFLRVAAKEPQAFLLESVEGGEHVGRYTFIGLRPYRTMSAAGAHITVTEGRKRRVYEGDIFTELKTALQEIKLAKLSGLPPFTAGAVGFFSYDVVRQIEALPSTAKDELSVPDAYLMFFDEVLAFDHVKKEIHLIVTAGARTQANVAAYTEAVKRLDRLEKLLSSALPKGQKTSVKGSLKLKARTTKEEFEGAVEATKEYIAAGDVFQCVLSQRFDCVPGADAFDVYRSLRVVNPSPYMYFLRFGLEPKRTSASKRDTSAPARECHIVGSSPELLVRVHDGNVEYRPIAGTRPRGANESHDRELEAALRADAKEVAEHVMLVDLGRNDVGRVSEFGSVQVKELMFIERYSHVMHLVSAIEGKLRQGLAPLDAFRACFPAGTLSGAPKVRAMEIIEEMEPSRRGVYGGSIVYADFSGNLDSCIAIRTLFMDGDKGHIQAGAGVVADSVPEKEYEECLNKAQAVVRAIERARRTA